MITLWLIGWFFTLGFIKKEPSFGLGFATFFMWPVFLGCEIRELLEKK